MANSARIPTSQELGIGNEGLSGRSANVPQTADLSGPFQAIANVGDKAASMVTNYVAKKRNDEINAEIRQGETEYLQLNSQIQMDLMNTPDLRGSAAVEFYRSNSEKAREDLLRNYSPEAAEHLEAFTTRHYAATMLNVGRLANERLLDYTQTTAINLSNELINQAQLSYTPDGGIDWDARNEFYASGVTMFETLDELPEESREKLKNAFINEFHASIKDADSSLDPREALNNLVAGRYGKNQSLLIKWKEEIGQKIDAQARDIEAAGYKRDIAFQKDISQTFQNRFIQLQEDLRAGSAGMLDVITLQQWAKEKGENGWTNADSAYTRLDGLRREMDRENELLQGIQSDIANGFIIEQKQIDLLYKSSPPQDAEGQLDFYRQYGLPSNVLRDMTSVVGKGELDKAFGYADLIEDMKIHNNFALRELGAKELEFYSVLQRRSNQSTEPKQLFADVFKSVYGLSSDEREAASQMWNMKGGYKEQFEGTLDETLTPNGPFRRTWESLFGSDVYPFKKQDLGVDGGFPDPPLQMRRTIMQYMEDAAPNIQTKHDYEDATHNAFIYAKSRGWGVTSMGGSPRWMIHPPEQDFPDVEVAEKLLDDDLKAIGYTIRNPAIEIMGEIKPGLLNQTSGKVAAGMYPVLGMLPETPGPAFITDFDFSFQRVEFGEDDKEYPVYWLKGRTANGWDFLRDDTGIILEWGGAETGKEYVERRRQKAKESDAVQQRRAQYQADTFRSEPILGAM